MSDNFQSCPGCDSLILADTPSCPECGYEFPTQTDSAETNQSEQLNTVHQVCQTCGDEVPNGLVRCWSCNSFMREDIAQKYQDLVSNPQKITFSDVPAGERTETIPPRPARGGYARILDADEFTLKDEASESADFILKPESSDSIAATSPNLSVSEASVSVAESAPEKVPPQDTPETSGNSETAVPQTADVSENDLLRVALIQEQEAVLRRRDRRATMNRNRILIPCPSCGVWLRIREEQSGKTVRCRSCKSAVPVPALKRKVKKTTKTQSAAIEFDWLEDIHVHLISPTDITLKHGSLQDQFQTADAAFDTRGLHLITLAEPPKKKSLFSRRTQNDLSEKREEIRNHIGNTGNFADIPHGKVHTVPATAMSSIRLVQPIRLAHESMFAGVPVFGDGRVVIYLPLDEGQQAFCSMPLSLWRQVALHFQKAGVDLPTEANGVPESEVHKTLLCHYSQTKFESVQNVEYYKTDNNFELELSGYQCAACGISVSEDARAKNKLGGASGKTIAKAKCPKCSAKFGNEPVFRISKAPERASLENDDNHPASTVDTKADSESQVTESTSDNTQAE